MHDITKTSPTQPITFLGRIGADPSRLTTIHDWWLEMDEPVELLADPAATFHAEENALIALCETNGIAYRFATSTSKAGFPIWLFRQLATV